MVKANAKNPRAVKALLTVEELKLGDKGNIEGLDAQLETIKAENDFLFEPDKPAPKVVLGGSGKTVIDDSVVAAARKGANLESN